MTYKCVTRGVLIARSLFALAVSLAMLHIIFDQILRYERYFLPLANHNYETQHLLKSCAYQLVNLGECTEIK